MIGCVSSKAVEFAILHLELSVGGCNSDRVNSRGQRSEEGQREASE